MIQRVVRAHEQRVFRFQLVGDIERKRQVAARVRTERTAVQQDLALLIDRAEMQQHAAPVEVVRQPERAPVEHRFVRTDAAADAGKRGFGRVRDADRFGKPRGNAGALRNRKVPVAVQTKIAVPFQRRARIGMRHIGQKTKRCDVTETNGSFAFSSAEGNCGLFGASGTCCVSRQTAQRGA